MIKEILVSYQKKDKGEIIEKIKPRFTTSFARMICRIQTRIPISLEKFDVLNQMGRFTLRDEGKTIAFGKVLKFQSIVVSNQQIDQKVVKFKEETKTYKANSNSKNDTQAIDNEETKST